MYVHQNIKNEETARGQNKNERKRERKKTKNSERRREFSDGINPTRSLSFFPTYFLPF